MTEFRIKRVEPGNPKLRNVPIAVTPEGFWCCPAPVVFHKTVKNLHPQSKPKPSSPPPPQSKVSAQKAANPTAEKKPPAAPRSRAVSDDQRSSAPESSAAPAPERRPKSNSENPQRKISVGFGQPETSDLKVLLTGKEGITVRMSVHRNILLEHSTFFAEKLSVRPPESCVELGDCEDVEIYVETVGLMYCKEVKHRLIRQNVPRVLRILKPRREGKMIEAESVGGTCHLNNYSGKAGLMPKCNL